MYYSGYEEIKELLFAIKNDISEEYKNCLITKEKAVSTLTKRILKEFDDYYKRLIKLNELKNTYADTTDIILLKMIKELAENLANPDMFKIIENKIINYIAGSVRVKPFADNLEIDNNIKIKKGYCSEEDINKPGIKRRKKNK